MKSESSTVERKQCELRQEPGGEGRGEKLDQEQEELRDESERFREYDRLLKSYDDDLGGKHDDQNSVSKSLLRLFFRMGIFLVFIFLLSFWRT